MQHEELNPGDRVEGLANFGKPTGEFGIVEKTNQEDAVVKWDDDGRMRLGQPWLKNVSKKAHARSKPAGA
jgi:transcription elongation factor